MSNGWVHVICGPMYSGKTEYMLRLVRRAKIADKFVLVVRPDVDTRTPTVTSRNGLSFPSTTIGGGNSETIYELYEQHVPDVIAIDEAQFFDPRTPSVVYELAQNGVHVIVSGLDKDFRRRAFGSMDELLVLADEVTKLTAVCFKCKGDASLTQRLVNGIPASASDPLIVVGGIDDDKYEARCRRCWELG